MCGIAGIVADRPVEALVRRMLERIAHRGPDGEGVATAAQGPRTVTFGHRRLSIVDLALGAQPMWDARGEQLVTFNGEIYNQASLRERLAREGACFHTTSDTEALVEVLAREGAKALPSLSGMFAFASFDRRTGDVLLARDRSGIKPLYVTWLVGAEWPTGGLAFASELDALLEVPGVARRVSPEGLASFFFSDYAHAPTSVVDGIAKLPPGTFLRLPLEARFAAPSPYVAAYRHVAGPAVTAAEVRRVLTEAVDAQRMSDVPLGVFLSGGLDSSFVAALAARAGGEKPTVFSIGFEEASFDESAHARQVASALGLRLVSRTLATSDVLDAVDAVLDQLDEPMGDHSILPTYLLCKLASEHVKVALGGDGADELFGGYPTYVAHAQHARLAAPILSPLRRAITPAALRRLVDALPASDGYQALDWKVKRFVGRWDDEPLRRHLRWMSVLDLPDLERALVHPRLPLALTFRTTTADPVLATSELDYATYLPGSVLTKLDRASMAHGLEARPPFLDEGVIALAARLRARDKVGSTTKVLLKEAARGVVPDAILDRPKHGFSVPLAAWMRGALLPRVDRVLADSPVWGVLRRDALATMRDAHVRRRGDHAKALWALVVLDHWMRTRHIDA